MLPLAKIFTVTKNETDLIEDFIKYHGEIFGFNNIIIIDNMSTCPIVKNVYKKYMKMGVTIVTELRYDGTSQGEAFTKHMLKYKKACKFLIGLDTDELFIVKPVHQSNMKNTITRYLNNFPQPISKVMITKYMVAVPDPICLGYVDNKISRPMADMRTFVNEETKPHKYFFRADRFVSTVNGCHNGKVTSGDTHVSEYGVYAHYHNTGSRRSTQRARAIVDGYKYTDTDSPVHQQLIDLSNVTSGTGSHRVLEYSIFLSKVLCLNAIMNEKKWPSHEEFEVIARKFPSLTGYKIDVSNMTRLTYDLGRTYEDYIYYDPPIERTNNILRCNYISTIVSSGPVKPKKVALMLSGHFRDFGPRKDLWIEFKKKFGDMVDIYIHTWNESGVRSKDFKFTLGKSPPDFELIKRILKPVSMLVEDHVQKESSFSLQQPGLKLYYVNFPEIKDIKDFSKSIGSQLYSIMKCWQLVRDSKKEYDLLVRLRADCVLQNFENIFTGDTSFIERGALVMNGSKFHSHAGGGGGCKQCNEEYTRGKRVHLEHGRDVCDIMYMGNPVVMKKVCNMFHDAKKLVLSFKAHNERVCKEDLVKRNCITYHNTIGVRGWKIHEYKLKCYYPERLIREYMKDYWVITDTLGLFPKLRF